LAGLARVDGAIEGQGDAATGRLTALALLRRVGVQTCLFAAAVFLLALVPRWVARDTYVTADEDNWMRRAGGFAWGVAYGRLGRT